jgi:phosphohistidine swiveling domain-containing protein
MMNRSKADQLLYLRSNGFEKNILPLKIISRSEIEEDHKFTSIINSIKRDMPTDFYIVRSSASDEDGHISNAGKYQSMLDVSSEKIDSAVREVLKSYEIVSLSDQVFVQPMLTNVLCSGVVFTKDPNTGSNYFVINVYKGTDTTAITSGAKEGELHVVQWQESGSDDYLLSLGYLDLVKLVKRVMYELNNDSLDIEFSLTKNGIYLLQVRKLNAAQSSVSRDEHLSLLNEVREKVSATQNHNPFLLGGTSYLGIMPDWNPAELIGIRPQQLSRTLFKDLITDSIWTYERGNLGYRNVRGVPLLIDLAGQPYIDVRASLNSLIPAALDDSLAEKLCNSYLDILKSDPRLHDKLESEVSIPNYVFDLDARLEALPVIFTPVEKNSIKRSLIELTRNIISENPYGLSKILEKHKPLTNRYYQIVSSDLDSVSKIYWLLEDCKRYGTLPFTGVARLAFIATTLVNSLIEIGILSAKEVSEFWMSIPSVTSNMLQDFHELQIDFFLATYGHLRPGTFDIRIPSYAESPNTYFKTANKSGDFSRATNNITEHLINKIDRANLLQDLQISGRDLVGFVTRSVQARESVKFDFTRNVSTILDLVAKCGVEHGLTRNQMAQSDIQTFVKAYRESLDLKKQLLLDIKRGEEITRASNSIWLPPLILGSTDIGCFQVPPLTPNFVSQKTVTGHSIYVSTGDMPLDGKIVLIESADPGFDWIFLRRITGLITCYGGANSHMAVRSKELNIPAAIGVGAATFESLKKSNVIFLDCVNKRIESH